MNELAQPDQVPMPRAIDPAILDAVGWHQVTPIYDALGYRFRLRCDDPELAAWARQTFAPLRASDDGDGNDAVTYSAIDLGEQHRRRFLLYREGERVGVIRTLSRLGFVLLSNINMNAVRVAAVDRVVFHAAMADKNGVGVLLPAPMESGKTTTVAGLVREGFSYLTDEAAAVSPDDLSVAAFPKSLSLDMGSWPLFPELSRPTRITEDQWQVNPAELRRGAVVGSSRPRLVIRPRYVRGATTLLRRVPRPEMVLLLADCTFHFVDAPRRNLKTISALLSQAACFELTTGSLDEAVSQVAQLVEGVMAGEEVA
jgi:hypothetical protein